MALHKVRKRATEPLRLLEHLLSLTYRFVDQATDIGRSDGIVWDPVVYGLALAESVLCAPPTLFYTQHLARATLATADRVAVADPRVIGIVAVPPIAQVVHAVLHRAT